jgi:hypothetical protein
MWEGGKKMSLLIEQGQHVQQPVYHNQSRDFSAEQVSYYLRLWGNLQQVLSLYAATTAHHSLRWVKGREAFVQAMHEAQDHFPLLPTQIENSRDLQEGITLTTRLLNGLLTSFEQSNLSTFFAWIEGSEVFLEALRHARIGLSSAASPDGQVGTMAEETQHGFKSPVSAPLHQDQTNSSPHILLSWYQYAALLVLNGALITFTIEYPWVRILTGFLLIASSFLLFEQPLPSSQTHQVLSWHSKLLYIFLQVSLVVIGPLVLGILLHTLLPLASIAAIGWFKWRESR